MLKARIATLVIVTAAALSGRTLSAQTKAPRVLAVTTRQAPDDFGISDYAVTTIGSVSFAVSSDDTAFSPHYFTALPEVGTGFFRYGESGGNGVSTHFFATANIPAGAVLDYVGLESYSEDGPDGVEVQLYLVDRVNNVTPIIGFQSTAHDYDTDYNSTPIGFQLVQNVHNQLVIDVENHDGAFGWVELWWRRTVSAAPATATFSDVPTTDPGFQYIEALVASGITGGCGDGRFCPDANLTRRQMAVFLAKALGLHWPY